MKKRSWLFCVWLGVASLVMGQGAVLFDLAPLKVWVTPLCWTGYVFLLDSFLYRRCGSSLIQDHPRQVLWMIPVSTGLWAIFEGYNLLLKNWEYLNIPEAPLLKYPGYLWSFGTILPALLETNALLEYLGWFKGVRFKPYRLPPMGHLFSFCLGAVFLVYPLFTAEPYDFPPVWLGFIFLLEPVNYRFGGESLLRRMEEGNGQRLFTLMLSGAVMGLLWEFWNYWAMTKWVYHVPVPWKVFLFEMPLLGFLGFLPFAVEFYVMYQSVRLAAKKAFSL